jgi:hypothetical protein
MDNYKNIRKVIINDNKDDIVIVKKSLNTSLSFSDILYDKVILPKEKLSSSYNYNILDISNLNNKELVINKNKLSIKNRSLSSDSLLNLNIMDESMYRNIYNKYLAFHNIVHK